MKKLLTILSLSALSFLAVQSKAQDEDKSKRPSPPAKVSETIKSGATITIDYSQPALKGRTMGKDVEPMTGKVWRAGANEATIFEVTKPVTVEGKSLPAGKYAFFTIANDGEWTIIFNKTWDQMGAFDYKQADDALRVTAKPGKSGKFYERLTYTISKTGKVSLLWGNLDLSFMVK